MIDDIYGFWEPMWWQTPLPWMVGIGILGGVSVGWGVYRFLTRSPRLLIPFHEKLYGEIKAMPADISQKEKYILFAQYIKQYVSMREGGEYSTLTDDELLMFLEERLNRHPLHEKIKELIQRAWLVKFSGELLPEEAFKLDEALIDDLHASSTLDTSGKLNNTKQ